MIDHECFPVVYPLPCVVVILASFVSLAQRRWPVFSAYPLAVVDDRYRSGGGVEAGR